MKKLIYLKFILDCYSYYLKLYKSFISLINTIDDWIVYKKLFNDNVDQTFRLNKIGTRSFSKYSNNICENLNPSSKSVNNLIVFEDINNNNYNNNNNNNDNKINNNIINKINTTAMNLNMIKFAQISISVITQLKMFHSHSLSKNLKIVSKFDITGFSTNIGYFTLDTEKCLLIFKPYLPDDEPLLVNEIKIYNLLNMVYSIMKELSLIMDSGYLNNNDLSKFPYFGDLINHFTNNEDYINGLFSHESFKWLYNIIYLSIYNYLIEFECYYKVKYYSELKLKLTELEDNIEFDYYHDLIKLRKLIHQKLDPSIRKGLQKRGISLIQNLNTGFDTEYVNLNNKNNKLLSVQFAQVVQNYIRIPLSTRYKLIKINPLTEAKYPVKTTSSFDYNLLENIIANHIEQIRNLEFDNIDMIFENMINNLKSDSSLKYFIKNDDYIIFKLSLTPERLSIKYIESDGYSMEKLLFDVTLLSIQDIIKYKESIVDVITHYLSEPLSGIKSFSFNFINELSTNISDEINNNNNNDNNNNYNNNNNESIINLVKKQKRLSRSYLNLKNGVRISISYYFNNVVIGHNTTADLSILTDFDKFKGELDIVNKCLITLGKGIKYNNANLIIRDTMLLAPAAHKSLSSIAKLYDCDKISLTDYEISHMDLLLKNNKAKFQEYALNDSVITLKHAIWMEDFHFKVLGTGVPTTLSNLGNKYVLDY